MDFYDGQAFMDVKKNPIIVTPINSHYENDKMMKNSYVYVNSQILIYICIYIYIQSELFVSGRKWVMQNLAILFSNTPMNAKY